MEMNKIFAAILLAGIIAMLSGFIAKKVVHPEMPEQDSYIVEVAESTGAAAVSKPTGPEPILALLATASVEKGEKLSKACAACHSFDKGGPNRVGPNLWDIVNAKLAHLDDFSYSSVFNEMSAEGKVWTYEELNAFLWKPKKYAPGTKMSYIGLRKPQDRADIIAWMRTLSDDPAPLPDVVVPEEAAEPAAE
jgi:cytochrome c